MKDVCIYYRVHRDGEMELAFENVAEKYDGEEIGGGTDFVTRDIQYYIPDESALLFCSEVCVILQEYDVTNVRIDVETVRED